MCICVNGYSTKMEDKGIRVLVISEIVSPFLSYHAVSCKDEKSQQLLKKKNKQKQTNETFPVANSQHFHQLSA